MIHKKHLKWSISFSLIAIVIGLVFYAPHYLAYSDIPLKSDAIILLVGMDDDARWKEALWLLDNRYATHIIIPGRDEILRRTLDGTLSKMTTTNQNLHNLLKQMKKARQNEYGNARRNYQNTHIEALLSRDIMQRAGFCSVIFVSHPYHMRRIKMITSKVFDNPNYTLHLVPTSYAQIHKNTWWLYKDERQWVISEYIKLFCFLLTSKYPHCEHGKAYRAKIYCQ